MTKQSNFVEKLPSYYLHFLDGELLLHFGEYYVNEKRTDFDDQKPPEIKCLFFVLLSSLPLSSPSRILRFRYLLSLNPKLFCPATEKSAEKRGEREVKNCECTFFVLQVHAANDRHDQSLGPASPFAIALETLQKQIGQVL